MTEEQVIAQFGAPGGDGGGRGSSTFFRYIAPINYLTREKEGYIGFEIHLINGRVQDWRSLRGNPSYEPSMAPKLPRWSLYVWFLVFGCIFVFVSIKAFDRQIGEEQELKRAYKTRDIPVRRLPADFHFITHDTTVQEVIDKLGSYSRRRQHMVGSSFAEGYGVARGPLGAPTIVSFDFELPYNDAVVLLPEYPFGLESRIRAVVYRPARMDDDV